jgi:prophage antirepressor-like protein
MGQDIQRFVFPMTNQETRIVDLDGNPWFIRNDACVILGHANPAQVASRLDDDEKGVLTMDTPGGRQEMAIVSEAGLYQLIMTSRKSEAKAFRRWVTHEVLPQIRKTGAYGSPQTQIDFSDPAVVMAALVAQNKKAIELQGKVNELAPKAEALDRISGSEGSVCFTDAAKMLRVSPSYLIKYLTEKAWIYKRNGGGHHIAYQDKIHQGFLEMVDHPGGKDKFGIERMFPQAKVTQRGLAKLSGDLSNQGFTLFGA